MDLSERKRRILQAIIDEYIGTAEPVGSRAISKKENLGLSSATIRNEMADLEEMGYLVQPHTSAGRVPSDAGYRFYVNSLMSNYKIGMEAVAELQGLLRMRVSQLEKLIKYAASIASSLTEYTTVATTPKENNFEIKKIDLVPIASHTVMLIVVTRNVRSQAMSIDIDSESCEKLSKLLNTKLKGLKAEDIDFKKIQEIQKEIERKLSLNPKVLIDILHFVYDTITEDGETEIYVNNAKSILRYPEYSNVEKAERILSFLEDKEKLRELVETDSGDGIEAKIGKENDFEILQDCSLVSINYSLGDKPGGKLAVIGPKRMNYSKVFASLDLISNEIDKILGYYMNGS
ncbi:MAG: heat-inducible transcription repressor HrcA [Oscillospiraceae bacterium]|nr:heat-inducible transcription repressor HrcA [Oscillospiraceae bacterium]